MKNPIVLTLIAFLSLILQTSAQGTLIQSWEGGLNGWEAPGPSNNENSNYVATLSTTGVTLGANSVSLSGPANGGFAQVSPNYGQMFRSSGFLPITALLANSLSVSVDVLADNTFSFLQFSLIINNPELGYTSLDGFSFSQSPNPLGTQTTLTWAITQPQRNTLLASASGSQLIFQVGGGGSGAMYFDNLRVTEVPEPTVIALAGLGLGSLLLLHRRRNQ